MILDYEISFWLIKILLLFLLVLFLIARILLHFDKKAMFWGQVKNLKFFILTLLIFSAFFRGTIVKLPSTFPDKSIDFLYIDNAINLYGSDEINYRKYSVSGDLGTADFYKFDDALSFKQSHLNDMMQYWNLSKSRPFKDFTLSCSDLKRCREESYLYAYTSHYEGWMLLEKNGEVIVVNYYYKANFKWYDYLIVVNTPTIPTDLISVLLTA